jgi:hypothetical protein
LAHHGEMEIQQRTAHDGSLRCMLCYDDSPAAGHDWCQAAGGLLCDECCTALLEGDPQRLVAVIANAAHPVTLDALARGCETCPRAEQNVMGSIEEEDMGPAC